jgi:hypothetical protein
MTMRAQFARLVESGNATCARCGEPIAPGAPFDLDHDASRTGYLGVSHRTCNRRAGATNGAAVTNARRRASEPEYVPSWSRVWSWPIPPDTYADPETVREYLEEAGPAVALTGRRRGQNGGGLTEPGQGIDTNATKDDPCSAGCGQRRQVHKCVGFYPSSFLQWL